ncbi:hypothetical protein [Massilia sp. DD77]
MTDADAVTVGSKIIGCESGAGIDHRIGGKAANPANFAHVG